MGVGYILGQSWVQNMTTKEEGVFEGILHNRLGCPDLTQAPARDDATKLLRQVLQAPAAAFVPLHAASPYPTPYQVATPVCARSVACGLARRATTWAHYATGAGPRRPRRAASPGAAPA